MVCSLMARAKQSKTKTTQKAVEAPVSRYPDLAPALMHLAERLDENPSADAEKLLTKWMDQLEKIQHEMQRLEKLEKFKNALKKDVT